MITVVFHSDGIPAEIGRREGSVSMQMTAQESGEYISKFRTHETDTGSPEVQVALLTRRINMLTEHFKSNAKDFAGRRGLMRMVSHRRSLLDYLNKKSSERYSKLITALNLRK